MYWISLKIDRNSFFLPQVAKGAPPQKKFLCIHIIFYGSAFKNVHGSIFYGKVFAGSDSNNISTRVSHLSVLSIFFVNCDGQLLYFLTGERYLRNIIKKSYSN